MAPARPKGLVTTFVFLGLATLLFVWIADVESEYESGYPPFAQVVSVPRAKKRVGQIDIARAWEPHRVFLRTRPPEVSAADVERHVKVEIWDAYEEDRGFRSCSSFDDQDNRNEWVEIGFFFGHGKRVRIQVSLDENFAWPPRVEVAVTQHYYVEKGWIIGRSLWQEYERPFWLVAAFLLPFAGAARLVKARVCARFANLAGGRQGSTRPDA
ncbi:MAG: hypothetical protein HY720_19980 [Planctomycetes bacterium]|nr:hypothetical protein [Planctomycetota bacterium]